MLENFLSFIFKPLCPLCQRHTHHIICEYCEKKLLSCKLSNPQISINQNYFLFVWAKYDNYIKRAIFIFKYDKAKQIGDFFGQILAKEWLKYNHLTNNKNITIVPIPLHNEKQKERGFNQSQLIANSFCQITGYQHLPNLLARVKNTDAMFGLNVMERQTNITQAFSVGKDYSKFNRQHSVVILDDIYTTGATVREAIKVLNILEINVIGVIAIASSLQSIDNEK